MYIIGKNVDFSNNKAAGIIAEQAQYGNTVVPTVLDINEKITNTTEAYRKPTVNAQGAGVTINDKTGMTVNDKILVNSVQYYNDSSNSKK